MNPTTTTLSTGLGCGAFAAALVGLILPILSSHGISFTDTQASDMTILIYGVLHYGVLMGVVPVPKAVASVAQLSISEGMNGVTPPSPPINSAPSTT